MQPNRCCFGACQKCCNSATCPWASSCSGVTQGMLVGSSASQNMSLLCGGEPSPPAQPTGQLFSYRKHLCAEGPRDWRNFKLLGTVSSWVLLLFVIKKPSCSTHGSLFLSLSFFLFCFCLLLTCAVAPRRITSLEKAYAALNGT